MPGVYLCSFVVKHYLYRQIGCSWWTEQNWRTDMEGQSMLTSNRSLQISRSSLHILVAYYTNTKRWRPKDGMKATHWMSTFLDKTTTGQDHHHCIPTNSATSRDPKWSRPPHQIRLVTTPLLLALEPASFPFYTPSFAVASIFCISVAWHSVLLLMIGHWTLCVESSNVYICSIFVPFDGSPVFG